MCCIIYKIKQKLINFHLAIFYQTNYLVAINNNFKRKIIINWSFNQLVALYVY